MLSTLLGLLAFAALAPAAAQAMITVDDVSVRETDGATSVTFTLTRVTGLQLNATSVFVRTADESARAGSDYGAVAHTVVFPARAFATETRGVTIAIHGDLANELREKFHLSVSGAEVTDGDGVATIDDDDDPPAIAVVDAPAAAEGAQATFALQLSAASGRDIAVSFATADASAVAAQDYEAATGRVTIPAGASSATVAVELLEDSIDEPAESFSLMLASPAAATLGAATASATILDNDEPPPAAAAPPAAAPPPASNPLARKPTAGSSSPDPAVPRLGIASPRLRRPSTALVTVSCPQEAGGCRGQVTLFSRPNKRSRIKALRRERRLGRLTFKLAGGQSRTLEMQLGATNRGLLHRSGRMQVRAYAVTQDGAGRTGVRTVNGTLIARTLHTSPSR